MGGRNRGGGGGGQKRGRTQRRDFKDGRENTWKKKPRDLAQPQAEDGRSGGGEGWEPFLTDNPVFQQYYKEQQIVPEDEWDEFIAILQKPLPAVFRVNASGQFAREISDQIQKEFVESLNTEAAGGEELVKPLPWYPGKLAWHLNFSRMQLRKSQTLARIHDFLKRENEIGNITRQEAVSMVPPLFLDVKPSHRVLDMCAAPGSKTFQLLEMIHADDKEGVLPSGVVIANDLDVQRCHLLIHQTKRMCSPNLMVTNHEAQHFPGLKKERDTINHSNGSQGLLYDSESVSHVENDDEKGLSFDRVLCDVPCSGDGTIRKAPDIWKKWNAGIANGLHRLQVQIAMRGVALLKVGGRLVYSTCSLNPVENEAVVGEILRRSDGCLELLDVSCELPELKRRPGMKTWKVKDRGIWISSYRHVNKHRAGSILPGMFPSGNTFNEQLHSEVAKNALDGLVDDTEEKHQNEIKVNTVPPENGDVEFATLPLERCLRILPHDQDTGGFFIAVFRKVSVLKVEYPGRSITRKYGIKANTNKAEAEEEIGSLEDGVLEESKNDDPSQPQQVEETRESVEEHMGGSGSADEGVIADGSKNGNFPQCQDERGENVEEVMADVGTIDEDIVAKDDDPSQYQQEKEENIGVLGEKGSLNEDSVVEEMEERTLSQCEENNEKMVAIDKVLQPDLKKRPGKVQQQGNWKGVDPVLFLRDEAIINSIITFYGIKETLPLCEHLITRSEDNSRLKRIYYVSKSVANVMKMNFRSGEQMKLTSVGLKLFERQGGKEGFTHCAFRIASEGLPLLLPHLTKQMVHASKKDFKLLLSQKKAHFTSFSDQHFIAAVEALLPGCCIVILDHGRSDAQIGNVSVIAIGCWRGRTNISLLIPSEEANQLLDRLFAVDEDNSNDTIEKEEEERKSDKAIETIDYKQIIVEGDGLVMVKETTIHKTQLLQKEGE